MTTLTIAALQMVSSTDVGANLETARRLVAEAVARGARLAVLPEYFCFMGRRDTDKLDIAEAPGDGDVQRMLGEAARRHAIWIVGGTVPLRGDDPAKVRNADLVFAPDGTQRARYDKMHLFRYDNGHERYDEGRTLEAGDRPVAFEAEGLRVGLSVCYDLRFPELYRALSTPPCDLLCVPSAFTRPTGAAHWHVLLRARAIENQCYVVAAAQGGTHENGRATYGHSLVVDPWGQVIAEQAEGEGVVLAEIDRARIGDVRRQLPALSHRRDFGPPAT